MRKEKAGPLERLFDLLFPARCLLCGERVSPGEDICPGCRQEVPPKPFRRLYSLPGSGADGFQVTAPMDYTGGFRKTLYRFKFQGEYGLSRPLGRLMAKAVPEGESFYCVAWVPMTGKKRREWGYDQSRLLAKAVARALGLPCRPLLEKTRETDTQHELSRRDREKNVRNAYSARGEAAGKSILLVDDIITTGATLTECAEALYRAGAKRVAGLCAADTQFANSRREEL